MLDWFKVNKNSRGIATFSSPRIGLHERGFAPILVVVTLSLIGIVGYLILTQSTKQTPTSPPTPTPAPTEESTVPNRVVKDGCVITGCSGEVCAEEPHNLDCAIVIPPDSCYLNATCERQVNGECDWTQTEELKSCIFGDTDPNDAQRKTDVYILRNVLEQYKIEGNNLYPSSLQTLISENYLKEIPIDPITNESYLYEVSADNQDYTITATFEDGSLYQLGPP